MKTKQYTKNLSKRAPNVNIIPKNVFPILSMFFFSFFFFFFFLKTRNSIAVVPIDMKVGVWTSFG